MNDLSTYYEAGLPVKTEDLAKFILIAPEKVKSLKAEIRAIEKAQLAKEVYDQKKAELDRLRELMLLAYQRMGEITREIPKGSGNQYTSASSRLREEAKSQAIHDLGLSTSQVGRMEQMAAHPDIVEEVIAESHAGQTEATQGEVLRRIKERENRIIDLGEYRENRYRADMEQIDKDFENLKIFRKAAAFGGLDEITDEILDSVLVADTGLDMTLKEIDRTIHRLTVIKAKLTERRMQRGKKDLYQGY